jgi:hypothetical protein
MNFPTFPGFAGRPFAREVRRVAAKGCHCLTFTQNPAAMGCPSFHDEYWNPLWRAVSETGTVLSVHIGSSGKLSIPAPDSPPDVMITLQPMNIVSAAARHRQHPLGARRPAIPRCGPGGIAAARLR